MAQRRKIPYLPGKPWNKNTVARLLQDKRYLGNQTYPSIIAAEMFGCRQPTVRGKLDHPQIKDIRVLARCGICGEAVRRERKDTWRCPNCMTSAAETTDKHLMAGVAELLQGIREHPDTVCLPPATDIESGGVLAAKNNLSQELECAEFNESAASRRIADAINFLNTSSAAITEWNEGDIRQLVNTVKVLSENRIRVYLQGGMEIEQEL